MPHCIFQNFQSKYYWASHVFLLWFSQTVHLRWFHLDLVITVGNMSAGCLEYIAVQHHVLQTFTGFTGGIKNEF